MKANQKTFSAGYTNIFFCGEFASAEGKKGGQFYTPKSIVKVLSFLLFPFPTAWLHFLLSFTDS
jgi:type I restriction enzyme M protein